MGFQACAWQYIDSLVCDALSVKPRTEILGWGESQRKRKEGRGVTFQPHSHSRYNANIGSLDVPLVPSLKNDPYRIASNSCSKGIDLIAFTDHSKIDTPWRERECATNEIASIEAYVGSKIFKHPVEYLLWNLPDCKKTVKKLQNLEQAGNDVELIRAAQSEGCIVGVPHLLYKLGKKPQEVRAILQLAVDYDLKMELNEKRFFFENLYILIAARKLGLQLIASKDSHVGKIYPTCTYLPGKTKEDALHSFREGKQSIVPEFNPFQIPWMFATYAHQVVHSDIPMTLDGEYFLVNRIFKQIHATKDHPIQQKILSGAIQGAGLLAGIAYMIKTEFSGCTKLLRDTQDIAGKEYLGNIQNTSFDHNPDKRHLHEQILCEKLCEKEVDDTSIELGIETFKERGPLAPA